MAMKIDKISGVISLKDKETLRAFRKLFKVSGRIKKEAERDVEKAHQMMEQRNRKIFAT